MTRINTIDPSLLLNEHLIAELRELPRIPNAVLSGKAKINLSKIPAVYTLGTGHVTFFYNKLGYLRDRHVALRAEYLTRNGKEYMDGAYEDFNLSPLSNSLFHRHLCADWQPTPESVKINVERIRERFELRKRAYRFGTEIINDEAAWDTYYEKLKEKYDFL